MNNICRSQSAPSVGIASCCSPSNFEALHSKNKNFGPIFTELVIALV